MSRHRFVRTKDQVDDYYENFEEDEEDFSASSPIVDSYIAPRATFESFLPTSGGRGRATNKNTSGNSTNNPQRGNNNNNNQPTRGSNNRQPNGAPTFDTEDDYDDQLPFAFEHPVVTPGSPRPHPSSMGQTLNSNNTNKKTIGNGKNNPIFVGVTLSSLYLVDKSELCGITPFDFSSPSPDDLVLEKQKLAYKKQKEAPEKTPAVVPKANLTATKNTNPNPPISPRTNTPNQNTTKPSGNPPVSPRLPNPQKTGALPSPRSNTPSKNSNTNQPTPKTNKPSTNTEIPFKHKDTRFVKQRSEQVEQPNPTGEELPDFGSTDDSSKIVDPSRTRLEKKEVKQCSEARRKQIRDLIEKSMKNKEEKMNVNLVVIGHVDAGKSTIMGHLLFQTGHVDKKLMNRYARDSHQIGKSSFQFAWVLDEHAEERERGITIDVAVTSFETKTKKVTLLDAPGHRDFVPNMITGAAQADMAILVLNGDDGAFEAGFKPDGQTREHVLLAKSLGVDSLIIVVNKMDLVDWSQKRYNEVVDKITDFLIKSGFKNKISFLPCSGFSGENLVTLKEPKLKAWYQGPSLLDKIDALQPPERDIDHPFRFVVSDIYKDAVSGMGVAVAGRVEAGFVSKGDQVLLQPLNEIVSVKLIRFQGDSVEYASAGQNVDIGITGIEHTQILLGSVLCNPSDPVKVCSRFRVQMLTFTELPFPLLKGTQVMIHIQSLKEPATLQKLVHTLDKRTGEVEIKRPKCLGPQTSAVTVIALDRPVCIELYSNCRQLGRFTLRDAGKTIGAGIITKLLN